MTDDWLLTLYGTMGKMSIREAADRDDDVGAMARVILTVHDKTEPPEVPGRDDLDKLEYYDLPFNEDGIPEEEAFVDWVIGVEEALIEEIDSAPSFFQSDDDQ